MKTSRVRLLLSDVDGTLVTPNKVLTDQSIRAVKQLGDAGILFAITSGRPPRGISMFVEPLNLTTPLAAFNGGVLADRDMKIIEQRTIRDDLVAPTIELLTSHGMSVWVYQDTDWFVLDIDGPHIQRESLACEFEPSQLASFEGIGGSIAKVVGVNDDVSIVAAARSAMAEQFGRHVSATSSQTYYLDVTHPDANKGKVVEFLSAKFDIEPDEIATIGDMQNDTLMFAPSGFSIAMGNADAEVRKAANALTKRNDEEGFAYAVNHFLLGLSG
ncbi:MAG TPA: Cof-type HAD-IIB family hydrolase [Candidatus Nanopelagicaceae bacterium]|nr:Cof-type HAD-IIB family hydrolase [Candidatus Nanopelagicaceae bacterium]